MGRLFYKYLWAFFIGAGFYLSLPYPILAEIEDPWEGEYEVTDLEKKNAARLNLSLHDLKFNLNKTKLGFDARWFRLDTNPDSPSLVSQNRSNTYLERDQKNVFFTPSKGKIYAGEEFSWAQLKDQNLVLYSINTDINGRYILVTYTLTPDGKKNLKFQLNVVVDNENYGDIEGLLVKKTK